MASKEQFEQLADKYVVDTAFMDQFNADPTKAAASIGIELTNEDLEKIADARAKAEKVGSRELKTFLCPY